MSGSTTIRRGFADSRYGQLHFAAAGDGPTLVLLPQAGRSSRMYEGLMEELAGEYRTLSIDPPGSGRSAPLPAAEVSVGELADALAEALAELGVERADLFGLHGGNKLGAALAARQPTLVRRFVFAGMSHSIVPDKSRRDAMFLQTPAVTDVLEAGRAGALPGWTAELRALTEIWLDAGTVAAIEDPAARRRAAGLALDSIECFGDRAGFYRAAFAYDLEADLRRIEAPTLVLEVATPREDAEVGRQGEALLRTIPDSTLITLDHEDVYAVTLEDRVEQLAAILRQFFSPEPTTKG